MDEVDEERDRELEVELELGGGVEVGTRLYLVHACRCCLVTERKQIEGRELESTSPFIFFTLSLSAPGLTPFQTSQCRHAHTHTQTLSVSFSPQTLSHHTHTHK